jgi:hypothetical protein
LGSLRRGSAGSGRRAFPAPGVSDGRRAPQAPRTARRGPVS